MGHLVDISVESSHDTTEVRGASTLYYRSRCSKRTDNMNSVSGGGPTQNSCRLSTVPSLRTDSAAPCKQCLEAKLARSRDA